MDLKVAIKNFASWCEGYADGKCIGEDREEGCCELDNCCAECKWFLNEDCDTKCPYFKYAFEVKQQNG